VELHEQLASPELSNKLHQLGVTRPSVFWRDWTGSKSEELEWAENFEPLLCEDNVNCYSVAELGEMLPRYIVKDGLSLELIIIRSSVWRLNYGDPSCKGSIVFTAGNDDSEADARAKMLIYLIENRLISATV
jgi:hypothetical protein